MGYSPWSRKELDTTEQLHFHLSSPSRALASALKELPVIQLDLHVLGFLRPVNLLEGLLPFPHRPK